MCTVLCILVQENVGSQEHLLDAKRSSYCSWVGSASVSLHICSSPVIASLQDARRSSCISRLTGASGGETSWLAGLMSAGDRCRAGCSAATSRLTVAVFSWCKYSCQVKSKSHCDWWSVSLSARAHDQMFLLNEIYCPIHVGCPLMRGRVCHLSVIVDSISPLSLCTLIYNWAVISSMYNIFKASVSLGSVQQTMPYF
jgi:hypothetical protein